MLGCPLLAVLVAQPPDSTLSESDLWLTILITAIALLLAHQVAFRLSSCLVNKGLLDPHRTETAGCSDHRWLGRGCGGCPAGVILGPSGIRVSEFLILAFVAATGYRAARSVPTSRLRALLYVGFLRWW